MDPFGTAGSHRRDFRLLWSGQFVSELGGQLTAFALPTIAIVTLHASPLAVGALTAFEFAIVPLLATAAGVIADRHRRKPLLIASNVVRALALASLPAAWCFHALSLLQFFVVGGVCAAAGVLFDMAYQALLPSLCGPERYHRGVARLAMSGSLAEAVGTGSAASIVQFVGAPLAVALNVISFAVSTASLLMIRASDDVPRPHGNESARREAVAGFRALLEDPVLRTVALTSSTAYLGGAMVSSVFALYCYRQLGLSPLAFGGVMAFANLGIGGALVARRAGVRFGAVPTLAMATLLSALGKFTYLLHVAPLLAIFVGRALQTFSGPIGATTQQTLQTAHVPDHLLGRMNAAMRTVGWAALAAGSLAGGAIGQFGGLTAAIAIGSTVSLCSVGWLALRQEAPQLNRGAVRHVVV
ncbi:MAG TPA: MFS transporter [Candidatus Elarobacter sp.]|jgi:MFS family permease